MPVPNLIHPVDVVIEQKDPGKTRYDDRAREAIQHVKRKPSVTVKGQPSWDSQKRVEFQKGGVRESSAGYVLFRKVDLDTAGITLDDGDRFKKIGHVDVDVYVVRLEWTGHYPDQDGPTMVKAHFADRQPSRQTRGVA
jgi:hypothetical protein